jgi:hypothetical protein
VWRKTRGLPVDVRVVRPTHAEAKRRCSGQGTRGPKALLPRTAPAPSSVNLACFHQPPPGSFPSNSPSARTRTASKPSSARASAQRAGQGKGAFARDRCSTARHRAMHVRDKTREADLSPSLGPSATLFPGMPGHSGWLGGVPNGIRRIFGISRPAESPCNSEQWEFGDGWKPGSDAL